MPQRVSDIVDLRVAPEVARMPYSREDLEGVARHALPVVGPGSSEPDEAFFELVAQHALQVRTAVEVLAEAKCAVVVHCHAGKDRTGWLCAMLQSALGLPAEGIEADYLASRQDTRREFIRALLGALDARGGARSVLMRL